MTSQDRWIFGTGPNFEDVTASGGSPSNLNVTGGDAPAGQAGWIGGQQAPPTPEELYQAITDLRDAQRLHRENLAFKGGAMADPWDARWIGNYDVMLQAFGGDQRQYEPAANLLREDIQAHQVPGINVWGEPYARSQYYTSTFSRLLDVLNRLQNYGPPPQAFPLPFQPPAPTGSTPSAAPSPVGTAGAAPNFQPTAPGIVDSREAEARRRALEEDLRRRNLASRATQDVTGAPGAAGTPG